MFFHVFGELVVNATHVLKMELLNYKEVKSIINKLGIFNCDKIEWNIENYSDKMIGYLGEHLRLVVQFEHNGVVRKIKMFIKCVPRFDKWKANYLKETNFFNKEYAMLCSLFNNFKDNQGTRKWRPNLLHIKEELFVFEDVTEQGYVMPCQLETLTYDELLASVAAMARFHAQSYIYEERKSKELKRPYRIWDDFNQYLEEPKKGEAWRRTGMKAVIDFLQVYSEYKYQPNFSTDIKTVIPKLFDRAYELTKPHPHRRNVVIHRDVWSNNILIKRQENDNLHALLVDFQTVLYTSPMLDLSSLVFFNTTKVDRMVHTDNILKYYFDILSEELRFENIALSSVIDSNLIELYEESLVFGMTQASLIVPIIAMTEEKRQEIYRNPEISVKINDISRSEEMIELAKINESYRSRVIELLDDIVERYVYSLNNV